MSNPETLEKQALRLPAIDPRVRIGHVHLTVADLKRALNFYCGVLGFTLTTSRLGAAFYRPAATITISGSTPGKAWVA
jgi:catechol-2,3-dioxygenase